MIKCKISKKRGLVKVEAKGQGNDICIETLALIREMYQGLNRKNPEAGEAFKKIILAGVLDPNSPVFKEDGHEND